MPASILEAPLLGSYHQDHDHDHHHHQDDLEENDRFQPLQSLHRQRECCCCSKESRSSPSCNSSISTVAKLAASFFCVYSAMDALSEYITSLLPGHLGDKSLFLLQASLCASTLAAPTIVSSIGELRSMMLGGLAHATYLASLVRPNRSMVLGSSVLCGFGASLTWVAQGTFLTKCTPPSKRGLFTGVFWGICSLSSIVGNLAAFMVFRFLSQSAMFGLGSVSATVGVLVLLLVDDVDRAASDELDKVGHRVDKAEVSGGGEEKVDEESIKCSACLEDLDQDVEKSLTWRTLLPFVLLLPITCYLGCQTAFWTGEFTKLLPANAIGIVLFFTGIGQVIGSFFLSWLSDLLRCGTPTFLVGAAASGAGLMACFPLQDHRRISNYEIGCFFGIPFLGAPLLAYVAGLLFGIADGVLTSHVFAITARIFHGQKPEIWAVFNLLGTAGAASTFWIGILFPISKNSGIALQVWIQLAVLLVGSPLYVILDLWSSAKVVKRPALENESVMAVPVAA
ncbi:hypothetical protein SELMODRAFT_444689 [Selaginella moellendorffii]|uniref:UNC93-like protein MFSD11 n=1 Tax=Selaginella moellendorffii TaxID=88036 RepID=D8SC45_SELML|nr:UNC93-like protein MFSD11 [Selaginella moellendorffii]EFJ18126.1 hypothetical protein SELMODRAFT_444689 [Selaginella moellendorffii]|eukprot:XP_002980941.1 UNC93-like protein MFSD11 [Selaginella moellendorffii]